MILRPSSVSASTSAVSSPVEAAGATVELRHELGRRSRFSRGYGKSAAGSVRLTASSVAIRFGFGVCGSISETVSTVGLVGASGAIGAGCGGLLFRRDRRETDLAGVTAGLLGTISGCRPDRSLPARSTLGATSLSSVVLDALAGLTATRERVDDDLADGGLRPSCAQARLARRGFGRRFRGHLNSLKICSWP